MTPAAPVLLLSRDPVLVDDVARLVAVAGADLTVVASSAEARRHWVAAAVVLVGCDVVEEAVGSALPRRSGVLVVTSDDDATEPWRAALALAAEHVVVLPEGEGFLVQRLLDGAAPSVAEATVIGVVGGSGGAGASVVSVALALAGARLGRDVLLIDADPGGGGLDLALGAEEATGARWSDFADVTGVLAADTLRTALPWVHGIAVLSVGRPDAARDPLPHEAVAAVVDSAVAAFDLVVLDLPRALGEVAAALLPRCDTVLVVVTPDVRGVSAAQRVVESIRRCAPAPARAVVRGLPGADLDAVNVAGWLDLDLAAEIRHDPRLTAALDRGEPPGGSARSRLARTSSALLVGLLEL